MKMRRNDPREKKKEKAVLGRGSRCKGPEGIENLH